MNKTQTLKLIALATSAGAIAFFGYKFYKTYKEVYTDAIAGEDLALELEAVRTMKRIAQHREEISKEQERLYLAAVEDDDYYEETDDLTFDEDDPDNPAYEETLEEGVEELRFPPNSEDALNQYKEMKLAEFDSILGAKRTLWMLFNYPYTPMNDRDRTIFEQIVNEREEFFGQNSIYTNQATIAELLLHFAQLLDFDLDGGIEYWADVMLMNVGVAPGVGEATMDSIADSICRHTFLSRKGLYGIFGLTTQQYEQMLTQNGLNGNQPMTFLRQYHVFISEQIDEGDVD